MRKVFEYAASLRWRINGWLVATYLRLLGCRVGPGLKCIRIPTFRDVPKGNIHLGRRVVIGRGVVLEIAASGSLAIGDFVTIGDYNRLSSTETIELGDSTLTAEHVSIRGSFHLLARGSEIRRQGSEQAPVRIGRDALLGTHTVVLHGAVIPDGAVIGAHSIVRKPDKLHPYGIFAGSPLKHIRDRT